MARPPGWLAIDEPRCSRLPLPDDLGDGFAEWCMEHDALWTPTDRRCRAVRNATRAGQIIVRSRVRWWHPGAWIFLLRQLREAGRG